MVSPKVRPQPRTSSERKAPCADLLTLLHETVSLLCSVSQRMGENVKLHGFVLATMFAGYLSAQMPYQQTHQADAAAPERLRANRSSYSAVVEVLKGSRPPVTQDQLDGL